MDTNNSRNKRIAKNTIYLYVRMILFLLIKLYTSRIALQILGVTDYGIYNLVAGIIVMFSFLNSAISGASQRFFNVALGENNSQKLRTYFINSVNIHFIIGLFMVILSETIGLYLLNNKLNIPPERISAAYITFHLAVLSCFFTILRAPYNAIIIAYEKMSFYAYISIIEVVLNLAIIYILPIWDFDKLNLYSWLMALITICILIIYIIYCNVCFPVTRYKFSFSKPIMKTIMSFSLWSTLSSFANIITKQSLNIILNVFMGVAINAASAIMTQVSSAIYSFIQNFQIAANPQLIQSYASNDLQYLKNLFNITSKASFYLMLFFSIPAILCMDEVLHLWLGTVPQYTNSFCILSIAALLINTLGGPIWTTIQASGEIKKYQTIIFVVTILNIPFYYIILYLGLQPQYTLYLPIITNIIIVINGIYLLSKISNFSIKEYNMRIFIPILKVGIISTIAPYITAYLLQDKMSDITFIITITIISILSISICVYMCGLEKTEKKILIDNIHKSIK